MLEYYYKKLLQAICFSEKPEPYFGKDLVGKDFLTLLKDFLQSCNEYSIMNEQMKDNLLRLVNYIRFNGEPELANEFILLINRSDVSYFVWQEYLEQEFNERNIYQKAKLNLLSEEQLNELFYSIELDYEVLDSLFCDDEAFEKYYMNDLVLDEFYFYSIFRIYKEKPSILANKQAKDRIIKINLENKKYKKAVEPKQKKDYKGLMKTGKVLIKTVFK